MFSRLIGGRWRPSYSGFDDVLLEWTAWKALTVNAAKPASQKQVQLVRGRYSRELSIFGIDKIRTADPNLIGEMVLNIWNERVTAVMAKYDHLRMKQPPPLDRDKILNTIQFNESWVEILP